MQTLTELGIQRLMVEGGATLNFELIRLGLVDEVSAYVAPMIFGGEKAPTDGIRFRLGKRRSCPSSIDPCGGLG